MQAYMIVQIEIAYFKNQSCVDIAEDWTGAINYYRNLPFLRVSASEDNPVDVPCLLIIGNQDSSVQLESVVRSAEYLSNYQLKIIDSVGHFPHQERPAEVNNLLLSFLISKYKWICLCMMKGQERTLVPYKVGRKICHMQEL